MSPGFQRLDSLPLALCVEDLMKVLHIGRNTAYALLKSGKLRSVRVGRQIRIPRDALRDFLEGRGG